MKSKTIPTIISTMLMYIISMFIGYSSIDDFSEDIFVTSFIFFFVLCLNFFCLNWRDKFISNFIIEKKLAFLFLVLAFINGTALLLYFFYTDGIDRLMYCTVGSAIVNNCICNFIYLR